MTTSLVISFRVFWNKLLLDPNCDVFQTVDSINIFRFYILWLPLLLKNDFELIMSSYWWHLSIATINHCQISGITVRPIGHVVSDIRWKKLLFVCLPVRHSDSYGLICIIVVLTVMCHESCSVFADWLDNVSSLQVSGFVILSSAPSSCIIECLNSITFVKFLYYLV